MDRLARRAGRARGRGIRRELPVHVRRRACPRPEWQRDERARQQRPSTPTGARENRPYMRVAPSAYADGDRRDPAAARRPATSATASSTTSGRTSSPRTASPSGAGSGVSSSTTPSASASEAPAARSAPIPFDADDPLERFRNDLGAIAFTRTPAAPGTGTADRPAPADQHRPEPTSTPTPSTAARTTRLDWLRDGTARRQRRQQQRHAAPAGRLPAARRRPRQRGRRPRRCDLMGRLAGHPDDAVVAGDVRANENIALTATHTLFAREHNRIVSRLPAVAVRGGEVPDRPPRRQRGAAVHHLPRVPAGAGRRPAAVHRLQPQRQPDALATSSRPSATASTA